MPSSLPVLVVKIANHARNAFCPGDELLVWFNDTVLYARLQLPGRRASVALEFSPDVRVGVEWDVAGPVSVGAAVKIRRNGSLEWRYQRTHSKRLFRDGHGFETTSPLLDAPDNAPTAFSHRDREQLELSSWFHMSSGQRAGMKRSVDSARRRFEPYQRPTPPVAPVAPVEPLDLPEVQPDLPEPPPTNDLLFSLAALQSAFDAVKAQVTKMQDAHEDAKPVCPVCLCENDTPTVFLCGHAYCARCAPKMGGRPCGVCRQQLSGQSVRVYL